MIIDEPKISVAQQLVLVAEANNQNIISTENEFYAIPRIGPRIAKSLNGNYNSFSNDLLMRYSNATKGKIANANAVQDAIRILRAKAAAAETTPVHLRYATHLGKIYVDLGDASGEVLEIDNNGWRVINAAPVIFKRTQLTAALPRPLVGIEIEEIFSLLNIAPELRDLYIGFLVASCFPDIAHPILVINGEQGSGKSNATNFTVSLLDPSAAPLRKPPRDIQSWVESANGSYLIAIDNISKIRDWESDAFCRASTGDGDVKRQHYSDSDLVVYSFRRVLIINGINLSELRDDLNDRIIALKLPIVTADNRKLESELNDLWQERLPYFVGALYSLCASVLSTLEYVSLKELPRMADFAKILAAIDEVRGTDSIGDYNREIRRSAFNAIEENQFLVDVTRLIVSTWQGSASDLNEFLRTNGANCFSKDWPATSSEITERLTRSAPTLRKAGWTVDNLGATNHEKVTKWRIAPPAGYAGDRLNFLKKN